MKRFLSVVIAVAALLLGVYYMIYYEGIYIAREHESGLELPFRTEGKELFVRSDAKSDAKSDTGSDAKPDIDSYEKFEMRGVEISSSMPGHYATEFYPKEEDYLRWFAQIQDMGANTLKPQRLMDDKFYNALYSYNQKHSEPLYLLQGISVSDAANYGPESGYDEDYMGQLLEDGKAAVDIIHGRKTIGLGKLSGTGRYRKDISDWTIGIVVGNDWNPDVIAYTDHHAAYEEERYEGGYISAGANSSPFEVMLAKVLDQIVQYETEKYSEQRPIGFINSPASDFLEYDENYAKQLGKYSSVDAEHLDVSDEMEAGIFAAYRLFDYCDDFSEYLSAAQIQELGDSLTGLERDSSYGGYLQLLSRYHTMPVLMTEYGFSSARGAVRMGKEPNDETEQGEKLMRVYRDAKKYGWSGVCISAWQDTWEQKTWNTAFAVDLNRRNLWHDVQTDSQNYGLMKFVPGKEEKICQIDGDSREWLPGNEVGVIEGVKVSLCYDVEGMYMLLEGDKVSAENPLYIPMDISREVGSSECEKPALTFDRKVDFVLQLDGKANTKLLVQERYQAMRERFEYEINQKDAFTVFPEKESGNFETVQMALDNPILLENYATMDPIERQKKTALGTWDTGLFTYGTENPGSEEYTSQTDFCFGENCVEIRIPWQLLNIADPTLMAVHRDYYENYGVEFEKVKKLWIGIADDAAETAVKLEEVPFKGLGKKLEVHERLKDSYYVVQEEWKGEKADEISDR